MSNEYEVAKAEVVAALEHAQREAPDVARRLGGAVAGLLKVTDNLVAPEPEVKPKKGKGK